MVLSCQDIWREISNFLDDDVTPELRAAVEAHLSGCRHCSALLDSTRNVIVLIADERAFELPPGFSQRLHSRLAQEMGLS